MANHNHTDRLNIDSTFMMALCDNLCEGAISRIKKMEAELQASLTKEIELGQLKSRFVSMASHEFRTPLSAILSSAHLLEKYPNTEDQPKRLKHVQRIVSSVGLLTDILNDFLNLGKIEQGKIPVVFVEFDLPEMIQKTIDEIKSNLKGTQTIKYEHEGGPLVNLDPDLLQHILMNLVSNASKFSPDDGCIEINTIKGEKFVTLSVKDHGIGIAAADQLHIKEAFYRAANAVNIQGTGLGLHIADRYSELMNGTIKCTSELYKGTEISITFPAK